MTTATRETPLELARLFTRDLDPEKWARLGKLSEAGGDIVADALNQLQLLHDTLWANPDETEDLLLLARAVADSGRRLRAAAIEMGLVRETFGSYLMPGKLLQDADSAIGAAKQYQLHHHEIEKGGVS